MIYAVHWLPAQESEFRLADFLAFEMGRQDWPGTAAHEDFEFALSTDPNNAGESRGNSIRIMISLPFVTYFTVNDAERIVNILQLRRIY